MNPTFRLKGTSHQYTPLGGPIDEENKPSVFAEIGHAIAAQSRVEHLVTSLVLHVNKPSASEVLHDPDPSHQYKRLLKLLRKWLTEHPTYKKFEFLSDDKFYTGLLENADTRNNLAHGFIESIDPKDGSFIVCSFKKSGPDTWRVQKTCFAACAPAALSELATLAAYHFVEVAKAIFERPETSEPPPQMARSERRRRQSVARQRKR